MTYFLENEYFEIVKDILKHPEYLKLSQYLHHKNVRRLDHCIAVSYTAYMIGKRAGLDVVALARAGLLHDFFMYKDLPAFHTLTHPKVALQNSLKYFKLSEKEKNIILSHMWPMSLVWPQNKEAWLIVKVDKSIALKDFFSLIHSFCCFQPPENNIIYSTDFEVE